MRGTSSGGSTGATSTSVSLLWEGAGGMGGGNGDSGARVGRLGHRPPPVLSRGFRPKLFWIWEHERVRSPPPPSLSSLTPYFGSGDVVESPGKTLLDTEKPPGPTPDKPLVACAGWPDGLSFKGTRNGGHPPPSPSWEAPA